MNTQANKLKFDEKRLGLYQLRQYEHDELYHADIVALGIVKRLVHVALHLSKYAYGISLRRDNERFKKDYTDAFVMVVSSANILNLDLSESIKSDTHLNDSFLSDYLYYASIFAKSCESFDHFEQHTFHESWKTATIGLFKLFEKDSLLNQTDLIALANDRLDHVETKIKSGNIKYRLEAKLQVYS